ARSQGIRSWENPAAKKSTVEQPIEHPAAAAAPAAACCTAARAATVTTRAAITGGPAKVPEIAAVDRSLSPHLAQLDLVGVAVRIGHDHGDRLPVPLGGCRAPAMRFDGQNFVSADVDDGHILEARVLPFAEVAGVILQEPDAGQRVLHQLPFGDLRYAGAEHLELDPERGVLLIACDVAVRLRLLDHPA